MLVDRAYPKLWALDLLDQLEKGASNALTFADLVVADLRKEFKKNQNL